MGSFRLWTSASVVVTPARPPQGTRRGGRAATCVNPPLCLRPDPRRYSEVYRTQPRQRSECETRKNPVTAIEAWNF